MDNPLVLIRGENHFHNKSGYSLTKKMNLSGLNLTFDLSLFDSLINSNRYFQAHSLNN